MTINVGIVGISGYTGLELVKMIVAHPVMLSRRWQYRPTRIRQKPNSPSR